MRSLRYFWISLLILAACQQEEVRIEAKLSKFFDLPGFIDVTTADSALYTVEKTVRIGEYLETKVLEAYDLWKDEQSFTNFDINRPALFEKYQTDTSMVEGGWIESYHALESSLHVQEMQITYTGDQVNEIHVRSQSRSFLENIDIELNWNPGQGYRYQKLSDRIFQDPEEQEVTVARVLP